MIINKAFVSQQRASLFLLVANLEAPLSGTHSLSNLHILGVTQEEKAQLQMAA